jgi:hypothetical protein
MLEKIEGVYENGQIQIDRPPHDIGNRSQVLVTFLNASTIDPAKLSELIDRIESNRSPELVKGLMSLTADKLARLVISSKRCSANMTFQVELTPIAEAQID